MKTGIILYDYEIWNKLIVDSLEKTNQIKICQICQIESFVIQDILRIEHDFLLIDNNISINEGITVVEKLRSIGYQRCIIFFANINDPIALQQLIFKGANGCVPKSKYNLLGNIALEIIYKKWIGIILLELNFHDFELWKFIVQGKTNVEISNLLFVEESTIEYRIRKLSSKLGIANKRILLISMANSFGFWQ